MSTETSTEIKDVVVVGGGPAGITAAWQLRDKDVLLLDENERLGGRLKSVPRGDYWLNFGAHLFPADGSIVREIIADLGIGTLEVPGSKTAMFFKGKVYASRRAESYPFTLPLTLRERAHLIRAGLIVRLKVRSWFAQTRLRAGESDTARRSRIARFEKDRTFRELLGRLPEPVDAIFTTAARRTPAEVDELSAGAGILLFAGNWAGKASGAPVNMAGGSGRFGEAAQRRLGDRVVTGARVTSVVKQDGVAVVHYETSDGPRTVRARHVVIATPAPIARTLVDDLPPELDASLAQVAYEPFVSMAVLTTETGAMPWDDLYAILTPNMSFNMIFNHGNPLRGSATRSHGGALMCYAGARLARDVFDLPDAEIERRFRADLVRVYPQLDGLITETVVQKWRYGNWYQTKDADFAAMTRYSDEVGNVIHFAGDYFAPVSGSIEDAAKSGIDAARRVAAALDTADDQLTEVG